MTGQSLEVIVYRYDPGTSFPRHSHAAEQITLVQRGTLVFSFGEDEQRDEIRLGPGDAAVIPGGVAHGAYVPDDVEGVTETVNIFSPVRRELPG